MKQIIKQNKALNIHVSFTYETSDTLACKLAHLASIWYFRINYRGLPEQSYAQSVTEIMKLNISKLVIAYQDHDMTIQVYKQTKKTQRFVDTITLSNDEYGQRSKASVSCPATKVHVALMKRIRTIITSDKNISSCMWINTSFKYVS